LGLQFTSDVPGVITGVRFLKDPANTGPNIGTLWSGSGVQLAEVVFSQESAPGWQQASFSSPVRISPDTSYVISYFAPNGNYSATHNYAWANLNAPPLGISGTSPGVYAYGSGPTFPTESFASSNYWVDPVFVADTATPPAPPPGTTSLSFWSTSAKPVIPDYTPDAGAVTLGLQFYSDIAGSISGIRFYKGTENTGPHVATVWSNTGTKLADVTVTGETSSGWQTANFPSPVNMVAGTPYVVSYYAPHGNYAVDQSYNWSALNAAPLHLASVSPGIFIYGSGSHFPRASSGSNYWVDPVFSPGATPIPSATSTISGTLTGSGATVVLSGSSSQSVTTGSDGSFAFAGLANGSYVLTPAQAGYSFIPATAAVVINGASVTNVSFSSTPASAAPHSVSLSWASSPSANISGYNIYRSTASAGSFLRLTSSPIAGNSYVDNSVTPGQTYFYKATTVDASSLESGYSNVATTTVPTP
jgi:hypothetical protein